MKPSGTPDIGHYGLVDAQIDNDKKMRAENATMKALLGRVRALLDRCGRLGPEYVGGTEKDYCLICGVSWKAETHASDCTLVALLKETEPFAEKPRSR